MKGESDKSAPQSTTITSSSGVSIGPGKAENKDGDEITILAQKTPGPSAATQQEQQRKRRSPKEEALSLLQEVTAKSENAEGQQFKLEMLKKLIGEQLNDDDDGVDEKKKRSNADSTPTEPEVVFVALSSTQILQFFNSSFQKRYASARKLYGSRVGQ